MQVRPWHTRRPKATSRSTWHSARDPIEQLIGRLPASCSLAS
ncbi:hypothetical protein CORC01_00666 [Colletotrichum orchidophilum]|uniref:Uncharacterized protein n=1 Tax=Colletotrichum orchidophilum TaxID=1209926 RepID=A0A1G4BQS1_9PEZI|nr:uncharacterized protein CORC01_00666 [Colletotrichum orchidophilum]OHF03804.1 hypothetical protein CORC01_00666 [Colletotrichum orchidophilum]